MSVDDAYCLIFGMRTQRTKHSHVNMNYNSFDREPVQTLMRCAFYILHTVFITQMCAKQQMNSTSEFHIEAQLHTEKVTRGNGCVSAQPFILATLWLLMHYYLVQTTSPLHLSSIALSPSFSFYLLVLPAS